MNRLKREKGRNKETGCVVGQSNLGRSPCALGETLIQREFLTLMEKEFMSRLNSCTKSS